MATKYLSPIDLAKNELQNAAVQNLASAPSSPVAGQIYFDTGLGEFGYYDGSDWVYPGAGGGGGTVTTVSVATANGFAGTVATASSTPAITIKTGVTGLLKGDGTGVAAASSGTDYAPATGTTSALKGNGSGGFSAAVLNDVGAATGDYSLNSHKLTNVTDPTSAQDAATKAYVDSAAAGIDWKASVRVATTANGTLASAYANGSTVDGVTLATGNRILIKNQTTGTENGIYTVNASGAPTRATDADAGSEVTGGLAVFVEEGTANADSGWVMTNDGTVTIGSTSLTFTQFTGLGQITAGAGLAKSGNTLSIENSGVLTVAHGGSGAATLTGLVKGNGTSAFTAATAGTDYAAATSGSSILKGNGSGGFTAAKFTATIGDGSTTSISVTDSLGTIDKVASIRDATSGAAVECDITYSSTTVTFGFTVAPATNAYKVVIIG